MHTSSPTTHHLHGIRVLLLGLLLMSFFLVRIDTKGIYAATSDGSVLAYATSINRTDLINGTNSYRIQNGLEALSLNSQLNTSAQNKAQHMIDNDYWAHVAPDGTQPWYFFDQAGYVYRTAGENLAYGFDTSGAIMSAWINSASHRANLVGDYVDVGFGYANGPSYQGGENTVVVAHYGAPQSAPASPPPVATPVTPAQPTTPTSAPQAAPTQTIPAPEPTPIDMAPTPDPSTPLTTSTPQPPVTPPSTDQSSRIPVAAGSIRGVSVFESIMSGSAPTIALVSLGLTLATTLGFALTHRSLVRHAAMTGEKFIMTHPAIDTVAVALISILVLTTTVGRIG